MDKNKVAITLLIIAIAMSVITVFADIAIKNDNPSPIERFFNINTVQKVQPSPSGGVNINIVRNP